MFAIKSILLVLLLAIIVDAMPAHHRRIRRINKKSPKSIIDTLTAEVASDIPQVGTPANGTIKDEPTGPTFATSTEPEASGNATTSSSSPTAKTGSSLISALMPVDVKTTGNSGWTTTNGVSGALPLSDATLKPQKLLSALPHKYIPAPDGKLAMQAHYPQGSYTFGHGVEGGISFYSAGPGNVDLTTAKEATLGYSVMFDKDFEFQKGGKLPGLCMYPFLSTPLSFLTKEPMFLDGGDSDEVAFSCSGGRRDTRCWSARFMWRTAGAGEFYTYLPSSGQFASPNEALCTVKPFSTCNPTYGASVGRGSFTFQRGVWNQISQRVLLNDAGEANGELELFFNGESVINVGGLMLRGDDAGKIRGIIMQTFFGGMSHRPLLVSSSFNSFSSFFCLGDESSFASPKDQNAYFSDFSVAITQTL